MKRSTPQKKRGRGKKLRETSESTVREGGGRMYVANQLKAVGGGEEVRSILYTKEGRWERERVEG